MPIDKDGFTAEVLPGQKRYEVCGRVPVDEYIAANDPREAARFFLSSEGVLPETVGSRAVIGLDEADGTPILEGDKYTTGNDEGKPLYFLEERVNGLGEDDLEIYADEDEDESPE